jgi:long-chain acyl-CoA synthetase
MADRFEWHPAARISGADSAARDHAELAAAFACAARGQPFRIGAPDAPPPAPATVPAFETLTSGTSGQPRRILRSQASWIGSFAVNAARFGIGPGMQVAVLGRMEHSLSLYGAVEALHLGATLHLLTDLRPDRQMARLGQAGVDLLYATPAQLRLLAEARHNRALPPAPLLRHVLVGGSKLDPATRAAVAECFPKAHIREFYGAAEASFITLADDTTSDGAVGRAYPGVSIAVRGDDGTALPLGTTGEIWVKSPYLFSGYAGPDVGSARWDGPWLSVGEMGRMDAAGQLWLAGRRSRMVTIADQNTYPEEIEAFLLALPGIARAAVMPRPDPLRGHVLEAAIVHDGAVAPLDPQAILAQCRAQLGPLRAPRHLHLCKDWPVLTSGKTDLATLAARLWPAP